MSSSIESAFKARIIGDRSTVAAAASLTCVRRKSSIVAVTSRESPRLLAGIEEHEIVKCFLEPESPKGREKITQITSSPGETIQQTIAGLDDRQAMLYDFRARLSHMKRDLAILLRSIASDMPPDQGRD